MFWLICTAHSTSYSTSSSRSETFHVIVWLPASMWGSSCQSTHHQVPLESSSQSSRQSVHSGSPSPSSSQSSIQHSKYPSSYSSHTSYSV